MAATTERALSFVDAVDALFDRLLPQLDASNAAASIAKDCAGLPEAEVDAAAEALRADPQTLRYLRLRVADLETRLADLTSNNRDVFEGFVVTGIDDDAAIRRDDVAAWAAGQGLSASPKARR